MALRSSEPIHLVIQDPRFPALVVVFLGLALMARRFPDRAQPLHNIAGPSWALPALAAIVAAGLIAWVWGGLDAPAIVHDESAYLLQAGLFARGRWALPAPVMPAAFAQAAVLVTPVLTAKMPPGHSLILTPGIWAGAPGLIPILLGGTTAALIVILARRVAGSGVALLTVALWLTQAGQWRWRTSYLSETTTAMLWLLGWLALLRWRETRRTSWLLLLASVAGLGAITRPLTMLAWAIPMGVLVLRDTIRSRRWKPLFAAAAVGIGWLLILPIQNHATLGQWSASPLTLYTKQYLPFDRLGFGFDSTPPLLELPADLTPAMDRFAALHAGHTLTDVPRTLLDRLNLLFKQITGQWRLLWLPALVIGLVLLPAAGRFGLATVGLLYLLYLLYAHESYWTAYYYESTPVIALVIAIGLGWMLRKAARDKKPIAVGALAAVAILVVGFQDIASAHTIRINEQRPVREFEERIRRATHGPVLVLVHPDPDADQHLSLIRNSPDPARERVLVARDLGEPGNRLLAGAYPDRAVFVWDQRTNGIVSMAGTPEGPPP